MYYQTTFWNRSQLYFLVWKIILKVLNSAIGGDSAMEPFESTFVDWFIATSLKHF